MFQKLPHENGKLNVKKDVSSANNEALFTKKSNNLPKCYEYGKLGSTNSKANNLINNNESNDDATIKYGGGLTVVEENNLVVICGL